MKKYKVKISSLALRDIGDLRLYLGEAGFAGNGDKTVRANCRSNRDPECFSGTISDHGYYSETVKRCPTGDCWPLFCHLHNWGRYGNSASCALRCVRFICKAAGAAVLTEKVLTWFTTAWNNMYTRTKTFSAIVVALITPDKILISIHRIARIIWRIKIPRRTWVTFVKQNCLSDASQEREGIKNCDTQG